MTFEFGLKITALLIGTIVAGSLACLPLYKWDIRPFIRSYLFIKILWWIPISAIMMSVLIGQRSATLPVVLILTILASREFYDNNGFREVTTRIYFVCVIIAMSHLLVWFTLPSSFAVTSLAFVCITSIFSD